MFAVSACCWGNSGGGASAEETFDERPRPRRLRCKPIVTGVAKVGLEFGTQACQYPTEAVRCSGAAVALQKHVSYL